MIMKTEALSSCRALPGRRGSPVCFGIRAALRACLVRFILTDDHTMVRNGLRMFAIQHGLTPLE